MHIATYQFLWWLCLCLFQWPSSCLVCVLSLCMWSLGYLIVLQYPWARDFNMGFYQWRDRAKALSSHTLLMSRLYAQFKYWTESERGLYLYGLFYPLELKAILCLPQREHLSLKFFVKQRDFHAGFLQRRDRACMMSLCWSSPTPIVPNHRNKLYFIITLHFTSFGKLHYSLC